MASSRSRLRGWSVVVLGCVFAACGPTKEPQTARADAVFTQRLQAFLAACSDQPGRTALLVGIDEYPPGSREPVAPLSGCVNDVERFRALLCERFGFADRDVFCLRNAEATHANIVRAFHEVLIRRAGPGTEALFFLAGHGSRVPDRSADPLAEPDRLDSTYLAYDSRSAKFDGERDLSDDELRALARALQERTAHVTVITDSCHSGGILRSAGPAGIRSVPQGTRALDLDWVRSFWPREIPLTEDAPTERMASARYLHVAACRRDQSAWEYWAEDETGELAAHGALSYFLVMALERAPSGATWRSILDDAAARMASEVPAQSLTASGALDREVFGGDFHPLPGFGAFAHGDEVVVRAGSLFGLRPGSELRVLDEAGRQRLGRIRVERAAATVARARWIEGSAGASAGALRVVEETRPSGEPPLRIRAPEPELLTRLAANRDVRPVRSPAEPADYRIRATAAGARIETVEGVPVAELGALEAQVEAELRWRALFRLGNERGAVPLVVGFRSARSDELIPGYEPVEVLQKDEDGQAVGDLRVRGAWSGETPRRMGVLELTNPHDRPLYFYVLSVAEDREVVAMSPAPGELPELLAPGRSTTVLVGVVARREWPLDRPMRDRYLVITTESRTDFSQFERKGAMRSGMQAVPGVLRDALERGTARGSQHPVDAAGWGVAALDLLVLNPSLPARGTWR